MASVPQAPTSRPVALRGNYAGVGADYTLEQPWDAYRPEEHALWRRLWERQSALLASHAAPAFRDGLERLGVGPARIPRFDAVGARLTALTGWQLVGVPGLIPEAQFFKHLAARRFPVTIWMRKSWWTLTIAILRTRSQNWSGAGMTRCPLTSRS